MLAPDFVKAEIKEWLEEQFSEYDSDIAELAYHIIKAYEDYRKQVSLRDKDGEDF